MALASAQATSSSYIDAPLAAGTPVHGSEYAVPLGAKSISVYVSFTAGPGAGSHQARVSVSWKKASGGLSFTALLAPGSDTALQPQQFDLPAVESGSAVTGWVVSLPVPAGATVMSLSVEQTSGDGASVHIDLAPSLV